MARTLGLEEDAKEISSSLARSLQSGHINLLFGSGASLPAIPIAGNVEQQIAAEIEAGHEVAAQQLLYDFLASIQEPTNKLLANDANASNTRSVKNYTMCLEIIETILSERRTTLLPKQATIFSTNYDLFIEKASTLCPTVKLNDGFSRVPSLDNRMELSSRNFFNVTYSTSNLYDYRVELPSVNLIKIHGSLSWKKDKDAIVFRVDKHALLPSDPEPAQIAAFIDHYAVILPQATKLRATLLDRTYYELLRIYANELDRPNTLLLALGFSFADEHILDITRRALKNPTLRLVTFAHDAAAVESYSTKFQGHNNVEIVAPPAGGHIDFERFNATLKACYIQAGDAA